MAPACQGVRTDQSWNQVLCRGAVASKNPDDDDDDYFDIDDDDDDDDDDGDDECSFIIINDYHGHHHEIYWHCLVPGWRRFKES